METFFQQLERDLVVQLIHCLSLDSLNKLQLILTDFISKNLGVAQTSGETTILYQPSRFNDPLPLIKRNGKGSYEIGDAIARFWNLGKIPGP